MNPSGSVLAVNTRMRSMEILSLTPPDQSWLVMVYRSFLGLRGTNFPENQRFTPKEMQHSDH